MSAHKTKGLAAESSVVVGDGKHKPRLHLRIGGLVALSLLILVAAGAATYLVVGHANKSETINNTQPTSEQLAYKGDYSGAQALLDKQRAQAGSKQAQADVYAQQIAVAMNVQKYDQAKTYAQQAEKLAPSPGTAYMIGYIAELSGDKKTAQTYLQLAINRLDKTKPQYELSLRSYQNELQKVSQ
ncbi:MAG: hypothetical protein WC498_03165 [Candidatus Saccharimonadales bacterium]